MTTTNLEWQETISRGLVRPLMSNFTSVADALNELVDNAIDHRWGQPLIIELLEEKRRGCFVIESDGGRGMGATRRSDLRPAEAESAWRFNNRCPSALICGFLSIIYPLFRAYAY